MEKVIKLTLDLDGKHIIIDADNKSHLRNLLSGCRVNLLLGAGFSSNLLGLLGNNESAFETLKNIKCNSDNQVSKRDILVSYLYWSFFKTAILPIVHKSIVHAPEFEEYKAFGDNLYRLFSERSNPVLDRQLNIFTTNYDPILELIFDNSKKMLYNDGFEGRIHPYFSTDNFSKSYYRQAVFSNRKAEIPSVNIFKIHGSVTWSIDPICGEIQYVDYRKNLLEFEKSLRKLFNQDILSEIEKRILPTPTEKLTECITAIIESDILDDLVNEVEQYRNAIQQYHNTFLIVNPTKEKFFSTVTNKNYYELLRIFSNELEKENTLLIVYGFSFRDEHLLDLTRRSMLNPSLKLLVFCYDNDAHKSYESLFKDVKNSNISYITLDGDNMSLSRVNELLSCLIP